jgi:hypothetical protein
MKKQCFKVAGRNIEFDLAEDKDNAFINALAEASEVERKQGADAAKEALKGALSIGRAFGVRPSVDGNAIVNPGDISATIDGVLMGLGNAEG